VPDVREPVLPAVWQLSLYERAGEASGAFVPTLRPSYRGVRGDPADPDRARAEAARRARGRLRRYCAANRLNRLGTLTYAGAGCHNARQVRADVAVFWRQLRSSVGRGGLPYAWVPEWRPGGHGLHLHFAVGGFIRKQVIADAWGRGFVGIKLLSDLPVGSTSLTESRRAASYLAKYVTKAFNDDLDGLHRYDVAQGFQPHAQRFEATTAAGVLDQACQVMRTQPSRRWSSRDTADWRGAPAVWFAWN
jgi:hypothetical protein